MNIVLVGGTGTLGRELARQLQNSANCITVFSRDEFKQHEMRKEFPQINYVLGDVRDRESLSSVMRGASAVFLLAAIKHVDAAENNPLEALKTNCLGAVNVAQAAMLAGVCHVIYSNTDKAVLPITTYGYTKAFAQNYLLSLNGKSATRYSAYSWGNIAASRGSVIPHFVAALLKGLPVPITDIRMSRFWLKIEDAANFMLMTYRSAPLDRCMIPPVKGATIARIVEAIASILGVKDYKIEIIGIRGTEKLYEVLESEHSGCLRSDTCPQFGDEELRRFLMPIVLEISNAAMPRTLERIS